MTDVLSVVQKANDARIAGLIETVSNLETALTTEEEKTRLLRSERDGWRHRAILATRLLSGRTNLDADDVAWLPMADAPRDRTPILARFHPDLFPHIEPDREDLARWNGRYAVIQHAGIEADGFDPNWTIAAPVGVGGLPDRWFDGWLPVVSR